MKPEVPNDLLVAIARGDGVPFVGSGPSKPAGFPDWRGLMQLMISWCVKQGISLPNKLDIKHLIDSKKFLIAADALRANMTETKYREFLQEVFDQPGANLTEFHQLLAQIPFSGAATTNYETLVERAFKDANPGEPIEVFTQVDHEQLGTVLQSKQFFVLKAHGTIERPETIVLGKKDYANLIHTNVGYRTFLKALFLDRAILFLGFGLSDPELLLLLEELREIFKGHTQAHHALIDVSGTTETEQKNFESHYGVKIIPYTTSSPDHPEVAEFLRQLSAKLPKYILAHTMNYGLKHAKRVLDADSHYRLVLNSDNEIVIREKYEGASKEKPLEFSFTAKFDSKKAEDREAQEAFKKMVEMGEPTTIKMPQLTKFVPPEILSPLLPDQFTEMQITLGPAKSNKTLLVRATMEPNDGPPAILENIALKNVQDGTKQIILSNEDQGVPWKLRQVIKFNENQGESNFRFDCVNIPIKQALKAEKFCEALSQGGTLTIESEETDSRLGYAKIERGVFVPPDPRHIKILEALETIQRKTGVAFKSPQTVSIEAANEIVTVAVIVSTGNATMMPPEMNFTVKEARELLPKFASGITMSLQNYADGWVSVILGQEVHLGPVLISCDKLHIAADDRANVAQLLQGRAPDDVISMRMTPVADSKLEAKYIAWLPSTEADTVRNAPIVRTSSLKNLISLLFDTVIETKGMFDIEEFLKLLAEAKSESTKEGIALSPLSLATAEDLKHVFDSLFRRLEPEQVKSLKAKLIEQAWLSETEVASFASNAGS